MIRLHPTDAEYEWCVSDADECEVFETPAVSDESIDPKQYRSIGGNTAESITSSQGTDIIKEPAWRDAGGNWCLWQGAQTYIVEAIPTECFPQELNLRRKRSRQDD